MAARARLRRAGSAGNRWPRIPEEVQRFRGHSEADENGIKIFAYPGYLVGSEISKLVNKGYQQFLKTSKTEVPATADHLKALHSFSEELKEALGLPSLYNESLGTVSESYQYDRIVDRDKPAADRKKRPWEGAGLKTLVAKKSPA